jgi:glycerol-3-phosphate dehydrogenase
LQYQWYKWDLGSCFRADLTAAEIRYLQGDEWAQTTEDVFWRRSKLRLHLHGEQQAVARSMATDGDLVRIAEWRQLL